MNVKSTEYQNHAFFGLLKEFAEFYDFLSQSAFRFIPGGTSSLFNIDTYAFSSMKGTLESINEIVYKGRINDGYALMRKYHDSIIINTYSSVFLSDNFSLEQLKVEKIDNWVTGKDSLPEYRVMSQYIRQSPKLSDINLLLYETDERYKNIRNRCNDHTHYNFYQNLLLNDNEIHLKTRISTLNSLAEDIENLFILHLSYIFFLNEEYFSSTDYVDYLDVGMSPEEGSQYWVAPFVQITFDSTIKVRRADIAEAILKRTSLELK